MRGPCVTLLFALAGCAGNGLWTAPGTRGSARGSTSGSAGSSGASTSGSGSSSSGSTGGSGSASSGSGGSTGSSGSTGVSVQAAVTIVGSYAGSGAALVDFAFDGSGTLYAADETGHAIAQFSGAAGARWAGTGTCDNVDGQGTAASFCLPCGMVWNGSRLLVADLGDNSQYARIRAIDGMANVTTVCGAGPYDASTEGSCAMAEFAQPAALAVDVVGNVYVADYDGAISQISADLQTVTVLARSPEVTNPTGLAVDAAGDVFIADNGTELIRELSGSGGTTVFASLPIGFAGPATPEGVAVDPAGNVYATDPNNARILRWSSDGTLTGEYTMDPASNQPMGMKFVNGVLYVADDYENAVYSVVFQ